MKRIRENVDLRIMISRILIFALVLISMSGLSVMSRLAKNRLQDPDQELDGRCIDWDTAAV